MSNELENRINPLPIDQFGKEPLERIIGFAHVWDDPEDPGNYGEYPVTAEFRGWLMDAHLTPDEIKTISSSVISFLVTLGISIEEVGEFVDIHALTIEDSRELLKKTSRFYRAIEGHLSKDTFLTIKTLFGIQEDNKFYPGYIAPSKN